MIIAPNCVYVGTEGASGWPFRDKALCVFQDSESGPGAIYLRSLWIEILRPLRDLSGWKFSGDIVEGTKLGPYEFDERIAVESNPDSGVHRIRGDVSLLESALQTFKDDYLYLAGGISHEVIGDISPFKYSWMDHRGPLNRRWLEQYLNCPLTIMPLESPDDYEISLTWGTGILGKNPEFLLTALGLDRLPIAGPEAFREAMISSLDELNY